MNKTGLNLSDDALGALIDSVLERLRQRGVIAPAKQSLTTEGKMEKVGEYVPLFDAKDLAERLRFKGTKSRRPEQRVYEMVRDGRIPESCIVRISQRHYMFHPDRIQKMIDEGGFVRVETE